MGEESQVRKCARVDCFDEHGEKRDAKFFVVLQLVPSRGYTGRPWRWQTNAVVCEKHCDRLADSFITPELWQEVVKAAEAKKVAPPDRYATRADFIAIPETEAVH